jgi:formylglycine-generating enzyme required for sulfatase activity
MFGLPDETEGDAGQPAAGNEWTVPGIGTVLLPVEAGSFEMGGKPVHTVRISRPYWIGKFEFTNEEYQALTGDDSVAEKYRALPRLYNWYDAALLCARLTGRERRAGRLPRGYEYRLPTEAEWEYAARGGSLSKGYEYSGSNDVSEVAWHGGNGPLESGPARNADGIRPVGGRKPNELGAHDMSGNVPEWCLDTYNDAFYAVSPEVDPLCVVGSRTLMGYGPNGYAPSLEDEAVARGAGIVLFQRALAYQEVTRPGSTRVGARCRMSRIRMLAGFRICLGPVVEHIDLK